MYYVELVAILVLLQYLLFAMLVGRERVSSKIKAPVVSVPVLLGLGALGWI